jgi:hypothetical protein
MSSRRSTGLLALLPLLAFLLLCLLLPAAGLAADEQETCIPCHTSARLLIAAVREKESLQPRKPAVSLETVGEG